MLEKAEYMPTGSNDQVIISRIIISAIIDTFLTFINKSKPQMTHQQALAMSNIIMVTG
jgi:hypothetical protein